MGFVGERVDTRGYVDLKVSLGLERAAKEIVVRFLLVDAESSYNVFLGRPCLNAFGAIVSTPHLVLKYPSDSGRLCTVKADQKMARQCYAAGLKLKSRSTTQLQDRMVVALAELDPRANTEDRLEPIGDTLSFILGSRDDQVITVGRTLGEVERLKVERVLINNRYLFAWTTADMEDVYGLY